MNGAFAEDQNVKTDRRRFLEWGLGGAVASIYPGTVLAAQARSPSEGDNPSNPTRQASAVRAAVVVSTWNHGLAANARAWAVLHEGGSVLDAVEQGVAVVESDFSNRSVGLGGRPDRDGKVTLDACIQDHDGRAGAVAFLQGFENPISVARAVLERTPHVMLVGSGAEQWALENGFERKAVEIPEVRRAWEEWRRTSDYRPAVNIENHDTIGLLAMDSHGRLAGACTTSGLAYKIHGRVGDSPIIGAGLFVDGDVGAACATGVGELVIRTVGSHAVVESMRHGAEPQEACREATQRVLKKHPGLGEMQVGFLAIRADGAYGGWAIHDGFSYAVRTAADARLVHSGHER
jgi:N4-(beta-N-acetylglucosaminyl)-L-asparaginase